MNRLPINKLTTGRLPTDRLPTDRLPTDRLPTDRLPTDRLPTDRLPRNRLPEDIIKRLEGLRFDHKRLVAYQVALEALLRGEGLLDTVPRGHGTLVDQTRRALESAYLNTSEGAGKIGPARLAAFRIGETEASEAGAGFEALLRMGLVEPNESMAVLEHLDRLCGLLTGLAHLRR